MIDDESELEMLLDYAKRLALKTNWADELTPEQVKRLELSIQQIENGQVTPHAQVMKLSKQWLTK